MLLALREYILKFLKMPLKLKKSSSNYQTWQIVISKDICGRISYISHSISWPCHCPIKRWGLTPLLWIWAGLWLLQPIEHDRRDGVFWGQIRKGDASSLLLTGTLVLGELSRHRSLTTLGLPCCEDAEPQRATCVRAPIGNSHLWIGLAQAPAVSQGACRWF